MDIRTIIWTLLWLNNTVRSPLAHILGTLVMLQHVIQQVSHGLHLLLIASRSHTRDVWMGCIQWAVVCVLNLMYLGIGWLLDCRHAHFFVSMDTTKLGFMLQAMKFYKFIWDFYKFMVCTCSWPIRSQYLFQLVLLHVHVTDYTCRLRKKKLPKCLKILLHPLKELTRVEKHL